MIGVLSAGAATGGESLASLLPMIVIWVVVVGGMMYFMSIKPQKKERQRMQELMSSLQCLLRADFTVLSLISWRK